MITEELKQRLVAGKVLHTAELLNFLAKSFKAVRAAYDDDQKLSFFEAVKIIWTERKDAHEALSDLNNIDDEVRVLTVEQIDLLSEVVFPEFAQIENSLVYVTMERWLDLVRGFVRVWQFYRDFENFSHPPTPKIL